ncbi:RHS repeat domain-containing protein [Pirellulaceae bacterium SH501]
MSNYGFTSAGTSYDDEDRLTGFARASGTFTQSWSLSSVGDWNSITTNCTAQNRTPHILPYSRHPYTDCICPESYCSTSSSRLSPLVSGLLPDFDNKLKSADVDNNGSNDVTIQYDALGRRVARQGTSGSFVYVQQEQQTIADYGYGDAPSSPTHRYVYASYIDEPVVRKAAGTSGTIYYLHRNQQYSITAVTTSSGSVAERYAYTAYGQPTILDGSGSVLSSSAINNRYTYTGREWDQTLGLYHFRARWMSGLVGRFMGRDPIGFEDGMSLYAAFFPIEDADPTGQAVFILAPAVPIGIGGAALYAAAAAAGVSVAYCLVEPTCLADAKNRARDMLDDLSDLVRPRPKPKPKWDPPYWPDAPKPKDNSQSEEEWSHYGECGRFSLREGITWVTPDGGLPFEEAIAITNIPDARCKNICEYRCSGGAVSWFPPDQRVHGHIQGVLTLPVTVFSNCKITKLNPKGIR